MPRLIVHIGTHKTATTSIQHYLFQNRAILAERGVFYPDYSIIGRKEHYAHLGMVNALSGRHKVYPVAAAKKFFTEVRRRAADYDTTIISAEPFYRHVLNAPDAAPEYEPEDYWPLRNAYIEAICDVLGEEAQIIVVFRRQADYAQSLYQEHVKVTRYNGNFQIFLRDFWYHFVFLEQAEAWDRVFPGVKAMSFDLLRRSGDLVGEFCRLLNLPVEGLKQPAYANEGLPADLVILKRLLHRTHVDKDVLRKQLEELQTGLDEETHAFLKTRSFFESRDHLVEFQSQFHASNTALSRFMLHQDSFAGEPFPDDVKPDQVYGDHMTPTFLLNLLALGLEGLPTGIVQD